MLGLLPSHEIGTLLVTIVICTVVILAITMVVFATIVTNESGRETLMNLVPWSARSKVAHAKARAEMAELRVRQEGAEIKYVALQPIRNKVMKAADGEEMVELGTLLSGESAEGRALRAALEERNRY